MKLLANKQGQTLLELLIAISILVITLVTTIALIVASIRAGRESTNKLIGGSLAREAVEIARNIRDSNWAATSTLYWDSGLSSGTDNTATPVVDGNNPLSLDFGDDSFTVIKQSGGEYLQGAGASGSDTQFYRLMYLNPICQNSAGIEQIVPYDSTNDCVAQFGAGNEKVGIRIITEVRWPSADSSRHISIEDRLYNWQVF
ncbi:MAG: hypothetical protein WC544_04610 [Patescibacteria group bacterium]